MKFYLHPILGKLTLSRHRSGSLECVSPSGQVHFLPEQQLSLFTEHELPILTGSQPFPLRNPSFILDLQRRRLQALANARAKKRRKAGDPDEPRERKEPKMRQSSLSKLLAGKLPPELQAKTIQLLTKQKKGK